MRVAILLPFYPLLRQVFRQIKGLEAPSRPEVAADYQQFMNDHTYATAAANPAFSLIVCLEALVVLLVFAVAAGFSLGHHRMKKQVLEIVALVTIRVEGRKSGHFSFGNYILYTLA